MALHASDLAAQLKRNLTRAYEDPVEFWSRFLGEVFDHFRDRMNLTDVMPIESVNSSRALPDKDCTVLVNTSTVAVALSLPTSPETGRQYVIKDATGQAGSRNIIVSSQSPRLIEGSVSLAISANYGVLRLLFTGSTWLVM